MVEIKRKPGNTKKWKLTCALLGIALCVSLSLGGCRVSGKEKESAAEPELFLVDESVSVPKWTDSYVADEKNQGDLRVIQISDPHYYSMRLTDECTLYQNVMAQAAGRDALHIGEILQAFFEQMQQYEPDVLIVSGDLSMNGEKYSHEDFAKYLRQFEEEGIEVLVIPGNHDINSTSAWEIRDNAATPADVVTPDEFEEIYADFGYKEAIYRDENSLSYVADIGKNCWVMMLDASIYKDGIRKPGGSLSRATRDWIDRILETAKKQGVRIFSTTHQNLLVHNENFISDYTIVDGVSLVEKYMESGVAINLSGHMHCMNIVDRNKQFYEVAMESISVWPNLYGQLDLREDGTISFSTHATIHDGNSYAYILDSTNRTLGRRFSTEGLTEEEIAVMQEFIVQMNIAYFSGKLDSIAGAESDTAYKLWKEKAPGSNAFMLIDSILNTKRQDHTYIESFGLE